MLQILIFTILSLTFFKAQALKHVELKSLKSSSKIPVSQVNEIDCEFSGLTAQNQKLVFKSEKFLLSELKHKDEAGTMGVYVNLFDFFGYRFHLEDQKKLVVIAEKEETSKKVIKKYTKVPASLISKVNFSTPVNNKSVNFKEVKVVCQ